MSLSLKIQTEEYDKAWRTLLGDVTAQSATAAQQAADHASERMEAFLNQSVYDTRPGQIYQRTERALESLNTTFVAAGTADFTVILASNAPYAAQIEQGNELDWFEQQRFAHQHSSAFIPVVSLDELLLLMDSVADEGGTVNPNLFFNRSGVNYMEPGPHVTPAAVSAAYHYRDALERIWNAGIAKVG